MSGAFGARHRDARFRSIGRGRVPDRAARGDHRIARNSRKPRASSSRGAQRRFRAAIAVLRFYRACIKDAAISSRGLRPLGLQSSLMSGFSTARQKMVDGQVRTSDVTDPGIIDAMLAVPREAFVPEKQQALAYLDLDLDVSDGGSAERFLIKPAVTAKLLQAAEIGDADNVLVVGCATGYVAALVARLAARVTATEGD